MSAKSILLLILAFVLAMYAWFAGQTSASKSLSLHQGATSQSAPTTTQSFDGCSTDRSRKACGCPTKITLAWCIDGRRVIGGADRWHSIKKRCAGFV